MARCSTLAVSNVHENIVSTPLLPLILLVLTVSLTPQAEASKASLFQDVHVNEENSQDIKIKGTSIKTAQLRSTDDRSINMELTEGQEEQGVTGSQEPQLSQVTISSRDSRRSRFTKSFGTSEDSVYSISTRAARSDWSADTLDITEGSTRIPRGARQ